jgi:hypothetical protein
MSERLPLRTVMREIASEGATGLWADTAPGTQGVHVVAESGAARLSRALAPYTLYLLAHFRESGRVYGMSEALRILGISEGELHQ